MLQLPPVYCYLYLQLIKCDKEKNLSLPSGGSNAFNFINFVAAVVTLVVNVNNNINNNNNNLNRVSLNANNANNANANVNNNAANIVIVMPGRWDMMMRWNKLKKYRHVSIRFTKSMVNHVKIL